MTLRLFLALALGLAVLVAVLSRFDLSEVLTSIRSAGLLGFAVIVGAGLVAEAVLAVGLWPLLLTPVKLWVIAAARQLRDSSSDVLPITQLGGLVFAARALVLAGMAAPEASASVIADLTTETFAQGLYVLVGVLASLSLLTHSATLSPYVGAMLAGALFLSAGSIGFAIFQMRSGKWVDRIGEKLFSARVVQAEAFHQAVNRIYRRRGRMALSLLLQFLGWIGSGLWLGVIFKVMGLPAGWWSAIALQALVEGLRSATVFIPAAIGVQEAGYAVLAPVFGLPAEIGLAVSLIRRVRDVVVATPVLLAWQWVEGRRLTRLA